MKKRRPVKRKKRSKGRRKFNINIKAILFSLVAIAFVVYVVYFLVVFLGIETVDPVAQNIASHAILSQESSDMEKTLFIFEKETDEARRISDVYVLFENKRKGISLLVYVPGNMYFDGLEEEFGSSISISSLRYAGDFLQEGRGVEYTLWQLSEIMGFRVHNYVWITTEAYEKMIDIYGETSPPRERDRLNFQSLVGGDPADSFFGLYMFSSNVSNLKTFFNVNQIGELNEQIFSNMSFLNVLQKVSNLRRNVERTQSYALDVGRPAFSIEKFSEKGGIVRSLNVWEYDKALRDYVFRMIDRGLEQERVRIEVYNATDIAGRALIYSRKIQNSGCDVVRFGNAPGDYERTKVFVSDRDQFRNSLRVVSDVLLGRFELLEERPSFMTTGDIVIILGDDIAQTEIF